MDQSPLNATLIERLDLHEELSIVKVRPDSGRAPAFEPGQFCTLGLPREDGESNSPTRTGRVRLVRRAYSIASSADVRDHLEFYLVLVEQGKLTTKLWDIEQGGRLWMNDRCDGHFTLDGMSAKKDYVMIATGTGLGPYMSMLRTCRARTASGDTPLPWRRCVLIHGTRLARDLGYRAQLERAAGEDSKFVYLPIVTREPQDRGWDGPRGRVQTLLEPEVFQQHAGTPLTPDTCEVFLCGNPAMIKSVQQLLEARGFVTATKKQPGNIHFERYW